MIGAKPPLGSNIVPPGKYVYFLLKFLTYSQLEPKSFITNL